MSDILLDNNHDLVIDGYDLVLVTDIDLIRQRIKQRLLTILGEWFLNTQIGLPWFRELNKKRTSEARVRALLIRQIRETEGVTDISRFELEFDSQSRTLAVSFAVVTPSGALEMSESL